ncbi:hypothetical protein BGS_0112 [Beggiatoa sp. SS]|nr:hypothetical protein BGS_0112 [Beggiatoa sp. SS]
MLPSQVSVQLSVILSLNSKRSIAPHFIKKFKANSTTI